MQRIRYAINQIKSSFWFLPAAIISFGIISAVIFLHIDYNYPYEPSGIFQIIFSESAASGRNVLSTIAGAMIAIAGTVFSITLVVLQLASSQFGPRLLRNFMYERLNQIVLGQYVATFLYCLIILNAIRQTDQYVFIPNISILVALLISAINIILLIIYIHNISISIQPSKIIDQLRMQLERNIEKYFGNITSVYGTDDKEFAGIEQYRELGVIKSSKSGYIQFIDSKALQRLATKNDCIIQVHHKPGNYLIHHQPAFTILTNKESPDPELEFDEISADQFLEVANRKSFFQDSEFGIHQIVEIAVKALSPGINDPFTAIIGIDNLTSVLCLLTNKKFPKSLIYDNEGRLRVIHRQDNFEGYLRSAFDQIRQFGCNSPSVIIRLMEALGKIIAMNNIESHQTILIKYADLILQTGEDSFLLDRDKQDLKVQYQLLKSRIHL